jgi:metal-responsive CopG/Arc/MetJ family transcriptional regulator
MPLKNVKRVTFSLPKVTIMKLEIAVPKNKRSRFVAELIDTELSDKNGKSISQEDTDRFWDALANTPSCTKKTALELQREDRASH